MVIDLGYLSLASQIACDDPGLGFRTEKIGICSEIWLFEGGELDLVIFHPGGERLPSDQNYLLPVLELVDSEDDFSKVSWREPAEIVLAYRLGQLRTLMGAPEGMMLAARLLCSGERPESLQRLFQAACRFRLSAKGETTLLGLPFIS